MDRLQRLWLGIPALGLLLAAGCAMDRAAHDPMLGERPGERLGERVGHRPGERIPPTQPYPVAGATPAGNPVSAGRIRPEDRLAIDNPPTPSGPLAQPVVQASRPVRQAVGRPGWNQPTGGLTWDQARQMLRDRGVDWQQLDQREGLWRFQCSIPNPHNRSLSRHYEAEAPDELGAIQLVLERMDADRPR